MKRVLLTGGTGFIGSAVLRQLLGEGAEVIALHAASPPTLDHPRLEWRLLDLLAASSDDLGSVLRAGNVSHCIHAAWYTNHADYLVHEVNRAWADAGARLAAAFAQAGGRRFTALGTCFEYDAAATHGRCSEDRTPLDPQTLYARSKLDLFRRLEAEGGDFAWARVFFVYGPGDRDARLVPAALSALARGEAFSPRFGGLRRDYIHVDDLGRQIVQIALGAVTGAVNTGTGEAPSTSEIVAAAAELLGRPELAAANHRVDGETPLIVADLARFRAQVGEPRARSIEEGLADTLPRAAEAP